MGGTTVKPKGSSCRRLLGSSPSIISSSMNRMRTHSPSILGRAWKSLRSGSARAEVEISNKINGFYLRIGQQTERSRLGEELHPRRLGVGSGIDKTGDRFALKSPNHDFFVGGTRQLAPFLSVLLSKISEVLYHWHDAERRSLFPGEIRSFLDYCRIEKGLSRNSLEAYRRDLERFSSPLPGAGCGPRPGGGRGARPISGLAVWLRPGKPFDSKALNHTSQLSTVSCCGRVVIQTDPTVFLASPKTVEHLA